jgi:hypothetical protein
MAGTTKVKYKHTVPVILHADMMEDFKKAINKDVGVFFREIQEDVVKAYREEEKKGKPPARGALVYSSIFEDKKVSKQITLDIFAKENEVIERFKEIKESNNIQLIRLATRNASLVCDMGKTYFRRNKN